MNRRLAVLSALLRYPDEVLRAASGWATASTGKRLMCACSTAGVGPACTSSSMSTATPETAALP